MNEGDVPAQRRGTTTTAERCGSPPQTPSSASGGVQEVQREDVQVNDVFYLHHSAGFIVKTDDGNYPLHLRLRARKLQEPTVQLHVRVLARQKRELPTYASGQPVDVRLLERDSPHVLRLSLSHGGGGLCKLNAVDPHLERA